MVAGMTPRSAANGTPPSPSEQQPATVYIVDDDHDLRDILGRTLNWAGYRHVACESGFHALESITPQHAGCVLIDLHLPDMTGLELRKRLLAQCCRHPFIILTGSGDVSLAVQSLQEGAVDFVQKPFQQRRLLARVAEAVERDRSRREIEHRVDGLTDREREVLWLVAEGHVTKEIARRFGISPRTVDVHRYNILHKMRVPSLAQLLQVLNRHHTVRDGGSVVGRVGG
jgi:two-component system, LuxR family, response regulator FixJ